MLIDPAHSHSPPLEDRAFYAVFEVRVGDETIRSYAQVVESWGTDDVIGAGLGYGSAITGIALLFIHFMKRQQHA